MLVLSRKSGERLVIGPDIIITVLEVRGNLVRLGCQAPPCVPIHREEVSRRLETEQTGEARQPASSPFFAECA